MKKIVLLLVLLCSTLWSIPSFAQFNIKGGAQFVENYSPRFGISGEYFFNDYIVGGADLILPFRQGENFGVTGRLGVGLGIRNLVANVVASYEKPQFRIGYGLEANFLFIEEFGLFARWSRLYPVYSHSTSISVEGKAKNVFTVGFIVSI